MGRKKENKSASPEPIMAHDLASPKKPENDYEAESAWGDIMRANEHKAKPDLMKRVMLHAKKKKKHMINSLADLKVAANARRKELQDGPDHEDDSDLDD